MSDDKSTSLVNLGELSKPADTLIKKVSSAVGGVFEPWQIKRVAKADAEASLIKANTEIEITDLHRRAMNRFIEEEANKQENMEEITKKSISHLSEKSDPDKMDDDWVTNFFDKSRIISDNEMQNLWAQVLAGEANSPGTYSKRTVNFLSSLDKKDAELFQTLCRYCWFVGNLTPLPLVFNVENEIYNKNGINFKSLIHLKNIGLINFDIDIELINVEAPGANIRHRQKFDIGLINKNAVSYYGQPLALTMKNETNDRLDIGQVSFTQIGIELVKISQSPRVPGFYEYVKEQWKVHIQDDKKPNN
ncbi:hypothetical protein BSPLISOX_1221 [uncultured Gammaproteobacteria bacterium]|nr:hypothetical protein BSPLISOX_1221 [uncultured Gammaproteobacteria bacterium]